MNRTSELRLVDKLFSTNRYRSRNWNSELATRYVFAFGNAILEASYFRHFNDDKFIKSVVELPTSFGCPVGCRHCASALLKSVRQLSSQQITQMALYILNDQGVNGNDKFLITYSGIGEGAFHRDELRTASVDLFKRYSNAYFSFTTVGFDPAFVEFCDKMATILPCHYLQVTYLHYDVNKLASIVPTAHNLGFDFISLLDAIRHTRFIRIRMNYVVINDFNDGPEHWEKLIRLIRGLEDKLVFRVSRLNETQASSKYGICPPNDESLSLLNERLSQEGFPSYVFASAMNDNMNCGQLAWNYNNADT